jgi:ribose transport system ATP-binding protein
VAQDVARVAISGLSKTFVAQRVLDNVELTVVGGEVHALLGENGSGKSTLIKILAGVYHPDAGASIRICGHPLAPGSPRDSNRLGLRFVHQNLGLIEGLTAIENVALGQGFLHSRGFIDWRAQREKTVRLLARLGVSFDVECQVRELRPVDRTAVAIARALDDDGVESQVLVLDEPTAALPPSEVGALFSLVERARSAGKSVIYVTHRLDEVFRLADRVTVLRDGVSQGTRLVRDLDTQALLRMILGDAADTMFDRKATTHSTALDRATTLSVQDFVTDRLGGIAFDVGAGEVIGFAGLTGSGREHVARGLVGDVPSHVRMVNGRGKVCVNPTPSKAKKFGLALVLPSTGQGAGIREFTLAENLTLPSLSRYTRFGLLRKRNELQEMARWISELYIRPADPHRAFALLSGGNQQKVVFSKWLSLAPDVLVLENPTNGVDVGARQAIYELIRHEAAKGRSFVVCSSDVDDLVAVCHRVFVLIDGMIRYELNAGEIDEPRLLAAMMGSSPRSAGAGPVLATGKG